MSDDITPALTRAEWAAVLANREQLQSIREQFFDLPFSGHALAALLLYEEPFGFSRQDVEDEREVADYCDLMTREHTAAGNTAVADTFRLLGGRHRIRAEKIAALLPPPAAPAEPTVEQDNPDGSSPL
jgi:hypothetical protein